MLSKYIQTAMRKTKYEILADDRTFYDEIPESDLAARESENLYRLTGNSFREVRGLVKSK